jgi:hypothetical protein
MSVANMCDVICIVDRPFLMPGFYWKVERVPMEDIKNFITSKMTRNENSIAFLTSDDDFIRRISAMVGLDQFQKVQRLSAPDDKMTFQIVFDESANGEFWMIRRVSRI